MSANSKPGSRGFTLIELLLTLAIILLLISMLLPALNRGHGKVRSLQCHNNLHQIGLGMIFFAHAHEDKFPMQVSTNQGGSSEFIEAGNAVQGDFYFSYKHFLPLATDLETPKLLVCPSDTRPPATQFSSLRNTNVSYFVAANPVYMQSDSILSGDRNLAPFSNSVARVGPRRPLRWTREIHQYRGNVLFADGHVLQLSDVLSLSNSPGAPLASLVMPSVMNPVSTLPAGSGEGGFQGGGSGGGGGIRGGNLSVSAFSSNNSFALTNGVLTNWTITSGPRQIPPSAYDLGGPGPGPTHPPFPAGSVSSNHQTAVRGGPQPPGTDSPGEPDLEAAHQNLVDSGRDLANRGTNLIYRTPWWLLALLLLVTLWLLKNVRENRRPASTAGAKPRLWFVARRPRS